MNKEIVAEQHTIFLEMLLNHIPVPLIVVDRNHRHLYFNDALLELNGQTREMLLLKKVSDLSAKSAQNSTEDFKKFDQKNSVEDHELEVYDRVF